jgi:hypothetical protein
VARGETLGNLHGIPVTIKGNVDLAGWATVNGSAALKENIAKETSPCVQNWLNAGAVIIGRTNTPEFSCRWETNNDVYGPTRNPWNPRLTAGGSSGGAAASWPWNDPLAHGTDLRITAPASAGLRRSSIRPSLAVFGLCPDGTNLHRHPADEYRRPHGPSRGGRAPGVQGNGRWRLARSWWYRHLGSAGRGDLPIALIAIRWDRGGSAGGRGCGDCGTRCLTRDIAWSAGTPTLADAVRVWKMIVIGELFTGLEPAVRGFAVHH